MQPLQQPLQNCKGPTIRIGREILCLPYAGFLKLVHFQHCIHFCRVLKIIVNAKISLVIQRPLPTGVNWTINFTKEIGVSRSFQKQVFCDKYLWTLLRILFRQICRKKLFC